MNILDTPSPAIANRNRSYLAGAPLLALAQAVWWASAGILLLLCLFLFLRRLTGGLVEPLDAGALLAVGLVTGLAASLLRLPWLLVGDENERRFVGWPWLLLPCLTVALLATSISLPGSPTVALWVMWGLLLGEEATWWFVALRRQGSIAAPATNQRNHLSGQPAAVAQHAPLSPSEHARDPANSFPETLPPGVTQQLTRSRAADGGESIVGRLRGDFQAGERTQNLHIAFCPPLATKPSLNAEQVEGPEVRIKTGELETYGARLELRLRSQAPRETSIVLRVEVHCSGPQESGVTEQDSESPGMSEGVRENETL
jgi:hypothetical protein